MKKIISTIFYILLVYTVNAQNSDTLIDIEGNIYQTISIGNQLWMKENLKTTTYRDSTPIPNVTNKKEWITQKTGAYLWYENDESKNKNIYGALYNWYTVETNKLCPNGWHVPTDDEWNTLEISLGMKPHEANSISYRGTSDGGGLKIIGTVQDSTGLWHTPNENATNKSGFSALPGGFVYFNDGNSYGLGSYGFWWSSSENSPTEAWYRLLFYYSGFSSRNIYNKGYAFSVRCVKD